MNKELISKPPSGFNYMTSSQEGQMAKTLVHENTFKHNGKFGLDKNSGELTMQRAVKQTFAC